MAKKSACPITRQQFRENSTPLVIKLGDREFIAVNKEFSTGSLGWNVNDKITLMVGNQAVIVQVGMNLTIVGSKDLPREELNAAAGS